MGDIEIGDAPVGFDLRSSSVFINDLSAFRFRGDDKSLLQVKIFIFHPHLIPIRNFCAMIR